MYLPSKPKVVLLGMMTKMPVAGVVWQNVHYLVGFERLGCEVYYVEEHARTPSMFMETEQCDGRGRICMSIRTNVGHVFHVLWRDDRCCQFNPARAGNAARRNLQLGCTEPLELAFHYVGVDIHWQGKGIDEKGIDAASGEVNVEIDPRYFRPTDVDYLLGNPSKAREKLRWRSTTSFNQLVHEMIEADGRWIADGTRNH